MFNSSSSPSSFHNPIALRRAFGEEKPVKRVYERVDCDLPVEIWARDAKRMLARGRALNLSMGGIFVETRTALDKGAEYILRIVRGNAAIALAGRLARVQRVGSIKPNQYGFTFDMTGKARNAMRATIDALRAAKPAPPVDEKKFKWYWGV